MKCRTHLRVEGSAGVKAHCSVSGVCKLQGCAHILSLKRTLVHEDVESVLCSGRRGPLIPL